MGYAKCDCFRRCFRRIGEDDDLKPVLRKDSVHGAAAGSTSRCTITTLPPQYIDVDGEVVTQTPARFSLAGEALRVLVPATFEEPWDAPTSGPDLQERLAV